MAEPCLWIRTVSKPHWFTSGDSASRQALHALGLSMGGGQSVLQLRTKLFQASCLSERMGEEVCGSVSWGRPQGTDHNGSPPHSNQQTACFLSLSGLDRYWMALFKALYLPDI